MFWPLLRDPSHLKIYCRGWLAASCSVVFVCSSFYWPHNWFQDGAPVVAHELRVERDTSCVNQQKMWSLQSRGNKECMPLPLQSLIWSNYLIANAECILTCNLRVQTTYSISLGTTEQVTCEKKYGAQPDLKSNLRCLESNLIHEVDCFQAKHSASAQSPSINFHSLQLAPWVGLFCDTYVDQRIEF